MKSFKKGDRVREVDPQHNGVGGTIACSVYTIGKTNLVHVRWDGTVGVTTCCVDALRKEKRNEK